MTPDQMAELTARLRLRARLFRDAEPGSVIAGDMIRAADLIDSMAQRELVECTACGAEVVRVPGKYDRQNTIAADELPQILREYGRACERAAYERIAKMLEQVESSYHYDARELAAFVREEMEADK